MCDCKRCEQTRDLERVLDRLPEEERKVVEDIYEAFQQAVMDAEYYKAIVQNRWPSADEIIAQYREPKT